MTSCERSSWHRTGARGGIVPALAVSLMSVFMASHASAAANACTREAATVADIGTMAPTARRTEQTDHRSGECLVDATSIIRGDVRAVLVDVRDAADAAALRIPGAIHLRPADVAAGPFLAQGTSIALLGMQADAPRLLHLCRRLHADGWRDVRVVRGGIHAWLASDGIHEGDVAAYETPQRIDTATLFEVLHSPDAVVLVPAATTLPRGVRATVLVDATASAAHLASLGAIDRPAIVAIVTETDRNLALQRARFHDAGLPDPLFHTGTVADLDAWIARQERMRAVATTPLSQDCRWN